MAKLKLLSGKEVCNILNKHGFLEVRQRGSHVVMQRQAGNTTLTIPVPNHSEFRMGTLQSIIRQSGLPRNEFEPE